jgi:uncharacterized protein with ParB-like and HNH nuclease domain
MLFDKDEYYNLAIKILDNMVSEIIDDDIFIFLTDGVLKYISFLNLDDFNKDNFEILLLEANEFYEKNLIDSEYFSKLLSNDKSNIIFQYFNKELPEWISEDINNIYYDREYNNAEKNEPYDVDKIDIVNDKYEAQSLHRKYIKEELELSPDYQRNFVWTSKQKSRLIESILIKIPLPIFYIDARDEDKWIVVDGLQRLTSIFTFMDNKFKLSNLEFLTDLNGKTFKKLERKFQRRIEDFQLLCNLVRPGTPSDIAFSIFTRINTLGSKLEVQEIRNAMYRGKSTKLLIELSKSKEFIDIVTESKVKALAKHMEDHAIILRYLSFKVTPYSEYENNDMDKFLKSTMSKINDMRDLEIESLKKTFKECMKKAKVLFSEFDYIAFTKPPKNSRPNPISKTLFESIGYSLDKYSIVDIEKNKYHLAKELKQLYNDENYIFKTSIATNNPPNVRYRFETIEKLFQNVIGY